MSDFDKAIVGALSWDIFIHSEKMGFAVVVSTLFQALGKALPAFILSLTRQILFLIPLALTLPKFMGLDGIWWSFPLAGFFTLILSLAMYLSEIKKLNKRTLAYDKD